MKVAGGPTIIDELFRVVGQAMRDTKANLERENPDFKNVEVILSRDPYSDELYWSARAAKRVLPPGEKPSAKHRATPLSQEQAIPLLKSVEAELLKRIPNIRLTIDVLVSRTELVPEGYRITTHTERVSLSPTIASKVAGSLIGATAGLEAEKAIAKAHEAREAAKHPGALPPGVTAERVPGSERVEVIKDPRVGFNGGPTQPVLVRSTRQELAGTVRVVSDGGKQP
jgi:hypothetical protein